MRKPPNIRITGHIAWIPLIILAALTLLFLVWKVFQAGQRLGGYDIEQLTLEVERQQKMLEKQEQMLVDYRGELTGFQRAAQIEKEASRKAQKEIFDLKNQLAESRAEADLLRSLISENQLSLKIKDFRLEHGKDSHLYTFQFNLVQVLEGAGVTKGVMQIEVLGTQNGEPKRLKRSEFSADSKEHIDLNFKHFQKISGTVRLPPEFQPDSIRIEIRSKNKKVKSSIREFVWSPTSR